ncbi:unnamed protein product [Rangifer tarandus platyrhynchus]|uniref:Uncharacterized protein n=2 Tax=Rangifer tarandus platyrhynchus TaxID=3082113 RepID=A0ABN8YSG0_RANTA|nr:unnamed protein product [Rangifer tarandus platyrhynchus]
MQWEWVSPRLLKAQMPLENTAEPAEVLSPSPGTRQRGCRETQRQASSLAGRDGSLSKQKNQVSLLPRDECRLLKSSPTPGCRLASQEMAVLFARLKSHFS